MLVIIILRLHGKFFLDHGADINIKDAFGRTPLRSSESENLKMIELLNAHDAKVDDEYQPYCILA